MGCSRREGAKFGPPAQPRYSPVHQLISVPGIVENRNFGNWKMEILSSLVHTLPPQVYNSANREGAKFGPLPNRDILRSTHWSIFLESWKTGKWKI